MIVTMGQLIVGFFIVSTTLQLLNNGVLATRCYCTDDQCIPYGVCESEWCLIGIKKDTNSVIRTCGTEQSSRLSKKCRRNFGHWSDICSCKRNFCNNFAFLRDQIKQQKFLDARTQPDDPVSNFVKDQNQPRKDEESLIFERVDSTSDDYYLQNDGRNFGKATLSTRTSLLTLLIIVVPLVVGAATIFVVAINYYCHLC